MEKQIFKVGDTVYNSFIYPNIEGVVIKEHEESFGVTVDWGNGEIVAYHYIPKTLSFTPYTLQGFTQVMIEVYNPLINIITMFRINKNTWGAISKFYSLN